MVNFLDIKEDTEFTFILVKNKLTCTIDVWMKYCDEYYRPIFRRSNIFSTKKLLSRNICSKSIDIYVFKKSRIDHNCLNINHEIIQEISIIVSNTKLKRIINNINNNDDDDC